MRRLVHLVHGEADAAALKQALGPEAVVVGCPDDLSHGPLTALTFLSAWRRQRGAYLREVWPALGGEAERFALDLDLVHRRRLTLADGVVLWAARSLQDSLFLLWACLVLRAIGIGRDRIGLHFVGDRSPGGRPLSRVGELGPLEPGFDPQRVFWLHSREWRFVDAAWAGLTDPAPQRLLDLLAEPATPLPFVRYSLSHYLSRYPDAHSGLPHWDLQLLRRVQTDGPEAARVISRCAASAAESDYPDRVGEGWLLYRLKRLGDPRLPRPLVGFSGAGEQLAAGRVELSAFGAAVLAGERGFLDGNPYRDHIGGVALDTASGGIWVRRGAELCYARLT